MKVIVAIIFKKFHEDKTMETLQVLHGNQTPNIAKWTIPCGNIGQSTKQQPHQLPEPLTSHQNLDKIMTQVNITNCSSFHMLVELAKTHAHYNPCIMVDVLRPLHHDPPT